MFNQLSKKRIIIISNLSSNHKSSLLKCVVKKIDSSTFSAPPTEFNNRILQNILLKLRFVCEKWKTSEMLTKRLLKRFLLTEPRDRNAEKRPTQWWLETREEHSCQQQLTSYTPKKVITRGDKSVAEDLKKQI